MAKDLMDNREKKQCKEPGSRSHLSVRKAERIAQRRADRDMPSGEMYAAAKARREQVLSTSI